MAAVQGIAFTVDEPELRSMYLNLLAAASDAQRSGTAHPSFAEIIRQLSPEEAILLGPVLAHDSHPIVEIRLRAATLDQPDIAGYHVYYTHVMNWQIKGQPTFDSSRALQIVNWVRLGLVTVEYDKALTAEERYAWVDANPQVAVLRQDLDTEEFKRVEIQRGVLEVTAFGRAFHRVVMQPEVPNGPAGGQ